MRNDEKREDNIGEVVRLQSEMDRLTEIAADFIGTEKELRSVACIEVAIDHAKWLRSELERALSDLKINAQMLSKQTDLARQAEIEREEARRFERDESRRRQEMHAALVRVASSLNYFDSVRIAKKALEEDI